MTTETKMFLVTGHSESECEAMDLMIRGKSEYDALKFWRMHYRGWDGKAEKIYTVPTAEGDPGFFKWEEVPYMHVDQLDLPPTPEKD